MYLLARMSCFVDGVKSIENFKKKNVVAMV
jgi:hypothetical protein